MDLDLDLLILVAIVATSLVVNRYLTVKDNAERYLREKEVRISAQNRAKADKTNQRRMDARTMQEIQYPQQRPAGPREEPEEERFDVGLWVPELLKSFGIDPDTIYEEEMPPDLKAFMPVIKGYVGMQGGLPGIMAKMKAGQEAAPPGTGDGQGL